MACKTRRKKTAAVLMTGLLAMTQTLPVQSDENYSGWSDTAQFSIRHGGQPEVTGGFADGYTYLVKIRN